MKDAEDRLSEVLGVSLLQSLETCSGKPDAWRLRKPRKEGNKRLQTMHAIYACASLWLCLGPELSTTYYVGSHLSCELPVRACEATRFRCLI